MMLEHLDIHKQKMNLDLYLTPHTKMNSKWTINLNIKLKTIKLSEENIAEYLCDLGFGNNFLDLTLKARFRKEKSDKLDFINIKKFCSSKMHC